MQKMFQELQDRLKSSQYFYPPGWRKGALLFLLIIGILLLAISASVAVPHTKRLVQFGKENRYRFCLSEFQTAVRKFISQNKRLPISFEELLLDQKGNRYLRQVYKNPFSGKADWQFLQESNRIEFRSGHQLLKE
ncbi:MAG: hypothetical protein HQM08_13400 [Candidatus Riflebacteria bacterium]|nr:hypothetical protein [Candidatus Riflebacteria bacterium]